MTLQEIDQLIDSDHDLASKVGKAIKAAAKVGPTDMEMQVDIDNLIRLSVMLGQPVMAVDGYVSIQQLRLSFLEVDAVIYARVK